MVNYYLRFRFDAIKFIIDASSATIQVIRISGFFNKTHSGIEKLLRLSHICVKASLRREVHFPFERPIQLCLIIGIHSIRYLYKILYFIQFSTHSVILPCMMLYWELFEIEANSICEKSRQNLASSCDGREPERSSSCFCVNNGRGFVGIVVRIKSDQSFEICVKVIIRSSFFSIQVISYVLSHQESQYESLCTLVMSFPSSAWRCFWIRIKNGSTNLMYGPDLNLVSF